MKRLACLLVYILVALFPFGNSSLAQIVNTFAGSADPRGTKATKVVLGINTGSLEADKFGNLYFFDVRVYNRYDIEYGNNTSSVNKINTNGNMFRIACGYQTTENSMYLFSSDSVALNCINSSVVAYTETADLGVIRNAIGIDSNGKLIQFKIGGPVTIDSLGKFQMRNYWGLPESVDISVVKFDSRGNIICLVNAQSIFRLNVGTHTIDTLVGYGTSFLTSEGMTGRSVRLGDVFGMALDVNDNVYYVDQTTSLIIKVDIATNRLTTFAGSRTASTRGVDSVSARSISIKPIGLASDRNGNFYFHDEVDSNVFVLRKIDSAGIITTIAGGGSIELIDKVPRRNLKYNPAYNWSHSQIACGPHGEVYWISQKGGVSRIFKYDGRDSVSRYGGVNTYADVDGIDAYSANFDIAHPINFKKKGKELFIIHENGYLTKVDSLGKLRIVINGDSLGYSGDGDSLSRARFNGASQMCIDTKGSIYVWDRNNARIRKISNSQIASTIAGNGTTGYTGDSGAATAARIENIDDIQVDKYGNVFLLTDGKLRKIDTFGIITTILGNGSTPIQDCSDIRDCAPIYAASYLGQSSFTIDTNACIYVCNSTYWSYPSDAYVYKILPSGFVFKYAGFVDTFGMFGRPHGDGLINDGAKAYWTEIFSGLYISINSYNELVYTDLFQNVVRKVKSDTTVETILGTSGEILYYAYFATLLYSEYDGFDCIIYENDGVLAANARFRMPQTSIADDSDNVYACDFFTHRIRKRINCFPGRYSTPVITGRDTLCSSETDTFQIDYTGGRWFSEDSSIATVDSFGVVHSVRAGVTRIGHSTTGICGVFNIFKQVTVNLGHALSPIVGVDTICTGTTTVFRDTLVNGRWSTTSGHATIDSIGRLTAITTGIDTIHYTLASRCGSYVVSKPLHLITTVVPGVVRGADSICVGAYYRYSDSVAGGVWSSTDSSIAYFDSTNRLRAVSLGVDTIKYAVTNRCGTRRALFTARVIDVNIPRAITGNDSMCQGSHSLFIDSSSGGTWSLSIPSIATVDLGGNVYGVGSGNDTLYYTLTNVCGSARVSKPIYVKPLPDTAIITGADSLCDGSTSSFSSSMTMGVWGLTSSTIATISSIGSVRATGTGFDTLIYTTTNGCGSSVARHVVNLVPVLHVSRITGIDSLCQSSSTTFSDSVSGGTWSSSALHRVTVDSSGAVTGLVPGIDTVFYRMSNMCGIASTSKVIRIKPLPNAGVIAGSRNVCEGAPITFSDSASGGVWTSSASRHITVGSSGRVTYVSAGVDTIFYTVSNDCGTAIASYAVNVVSLPHAGIITGATTICIGGISRYSDSAHGGNWYLTSTRASIDTTGRVTATALGFDTVLYVKSNVCASDTAVYPLHILGLPDAGIISGFDSICQGNRGGFTDTVSGGTWRLTNISLGTLSSTGDFRAISAGVDTVEYIVSNYCGSDTASKRILILTPPVLSSINGPDSLCLGVYYSFTDSSIGGRWSVSNTAIATVDSTGRVLANRVGIDTISYTKTNFCGTSSRTRIVYIHSIPSPSVITGSANLCLGDSTLLHDTATNGVWLTLRGNATVNRIGEVSGLLWGLDSVFYVVSNSCGADTAIFRVRVDTIPVVGLINGVDSVCIDSSITLNNPTAGGVWVSRGVILRVSSTGVVTGLAVGIDTVKYVAISTCGADSAYKVITVYDCRLGIDELSGGELVSVFPNPTSNLLYVEVERNVGLLSVSLLDVVGKQVAQFNAHSPKLSIDVSDLSPGVYMLQVKVAGHIYNKKIIVE